MYGKLLPLSLSVAFTLSGWSAMTQKRITVADIYEKRTFSEKRVYGIDWMNDGRYYSAREGNNIVKYDITTGYITDTLLNGSTLSPRIDFSDYSFNADERKILLVAEKKRIYRRSYTAEFYLYDVTQKTIKKLSENGRQSYATLSPDGKKIAFCRSNDLFYVDLDNDREIRVTDDGRFNHIINGSTDWVYEEEFALTRAFEWSGDSESLLYLTFDESDVKEYNMQVWKNGQLYPEDYRYKYPKAGEDNAKVTATVYSLRSNTKTPVSLGTGQDYYIARVKPTKDPKMWSVIRLNRTQNQLDIVHVTTNGRATTVLTEKNDRYIDIDYIDELTYLDDGKHFIHASERSGHKHLYRYTTEGKPVNQITKGDWDVVTLAGIGQAGGKPTIYFTSTERSPLQRHLYSIRVDGKDRQLLRGEAGYHSVNMSGDCRYYIDSYSSPDHPLRVSLYRTAANVRVKVLEDNEALMATSREYGLSKKEFFTYGTTDGTVLNGYMLKPPNFDAGRQYPVLLFQYSGPGSQMALYNWGGGSHFYWHQLLAQQGYIIAVIDPRGTGGRGEAFKKLTYRQLGKYEAIDHIAGARYLAGLPYIDADRIGIWGWSYGGYLSSLAMFTGEGVFKAAIAVAPVTNWRFYDTIYTERYMDTPRNNPDGYDDNSPTTHAAKLEGNYLLIHGTGDDNVHFQNAVALQNALIAEGKSFDSFYYPDRSHGISEANARPHLFRLMTDWVLKNL